MAERIPVREVQGLEQSSGVVELFEIELSSSSSAYFTRGQDSDLGTVQMYDYSTNSQLNSYTAIPLDLEGVDVTTKGVTSRPVLTVSNILTDFETAISPLDFQDLIGKKLY